ncbi:MAG TPA: hypothetical protein VM076_19290 [Gemmatimonadaceae bacterium]|nr:hypothetical protein [Gemmatimonadaceae bacterium]
MHASEHPTPPRPLPANVTRALAAFVAGGSAAELEQLVRGYVRALRAAGLPPEQALRRVKDVVAAVPITPLPIRTARTVEKLAGDVVVWFVAEYYRVD